MTYTTGRVVHSIGSWACLIGAATLSLATVVPRARAQGPQEPTEEMALLNRILTEVGQDRRFGVFEPSPFRPQDLAGPPPRQQAQPTPEMAQAIGKQAPLTGYADADAAEKKALAAAAIKAAQWASLGMSLLNSAEQMLQAYRALTQNDPTMQPDYLPPGAPDVPSSLGGNERGAEDYRAAQAELNRIRTLLERLRIIYARTKLFADRYIAMGTSISSMHGMLGVGWQAERFKIEKQVETLKQSYDAKYAELIPKVQQALRRISDCEAKYFNNPDWYDRYGYMYYIFLADHYKRRD